MPPSRAPCRQTTSNAASRPTTGTLPPAHKKAAILNMLTAPMEFKEKILVIHRGGLGQFIKALGSMAAIRQRHSSAHITLQTTMPFRDIAQRSGYFDDIAIDTHPKFYEIRRWLSHLKPLKA